MSFIVSRAALNSKIDDLVQAREEVFNETLQDMLRVAIANYSGQDNADGPSLPKTPSTSRRLRSRQQRKRKQPDDGSPQLSRTLRSNASKQKRVKSIVTMPDEPAMPLSNISNTLNNTDELATATVRRSSRQCATKATQAIQATTGRKRKAGFGKECDVNLSVLSNNSDENKIISAPQAQEPNPPPQGEEVVPQQNNILLSNDECNSSKKSSQVIFDKSCVENAAADVPDLSTQKQTTEVVSSPVRCQELAVIDSMDSPDLEPVLFLHCCHTDKQQKLTTKGSSPVVSGDEESTLPNITCADFFTPLVITDNQIASNAGTQICTAPQQSQAAQLIVHDECALSVDLASLTKVTPPNPIAVPQTPATVVTDYNSGFKVPTTINIGPSSSYTVETPATVKNEASCFASATVTKHDGNTKQHNDGSPELIRKLTDAQKEFPFICTTKQQTSAFSPSKIKLLVPMEPSGLLHSCHAPPKITLVGNKKLASKANHEQHILEAKERLAEKNRRDKERLQQLEKKKEQERSEKKRKKQEQLRKVQERQALMNKKKEAQKMQQKPTYVTIAEQPIKSKVTENQYHEVPKNGDLGKRLKVFESAASHCESDEEYYQEEVKRKLVNCTNHTDYNRYIESEMEKANLEKTRLCSIDKLPVDSSETASLQLPSHSNCMDSNEDYGLTDLHSDDSTDEEDDPRKPIPIWAQEHHLLTCIEEQEDRPLNASIAVFSVDTDPVNLRRIFKYNKQRFLKRTSSAQWGTPPSKTTNGWMV